MNRDLDVPGDIFDIDVPLPPKPRKTQEVEFVAYENQGRNLANDTSYRLWSTDQSSYFYLPGAHLEIDYKVTKSDDSAPATTANNQVTLASNGWYMFEDARLLISDVEVHHIQKPGKVAHLKMLCDSSKDWVEQCGANQHYFLDEVSDKGDVTTIDAVDPVTGAATTASTTPVGFYYEDQYTRTVGASETNSHVTSVLPNPLFDPAYKRKLDRQIAAGTGYQRCVLPLKDIFPFCNLPRVLKGSRIEFRANKIATAVEALFGDSGVDGATPGKLVINRMQLWIPRVTPNPAVQSSLIDKITSMKSADSKVVHTFENCLLYSYPYSDTSAGQKTYQLVHKQNLPLKVIVGFQFANRATSDKLNPLKYDLLGADDACQISDIHMNHNGRMVPNVRYNPKDEGHARILNDFYRVCNIDDEGSSCITEENWASMFPLFSFDLSHLSNEAMESVTQSVLDLKWTVASGGASRAYTVFAWVFSEQKVKIDYSGMTSTVVTMN